MITSAQAGAPTEGIKTCVVQADLSLPVPVEWREAGIVEKLTIFPVKSCMGKVVNEAQVQSQANPQMDHRLLIELGSNLDQIFRYAMANGSISFLFNFDGHMGL